MTTLLLWIGLQDASYDKAVTYVAENYQKAQVVPLIFAGFVFMLDGREELKPEFEKVVQRAMGCCKGPGGFHANWEAAYSGLFLSIVYLRTPRADIKEALQALPAAAEKGIESSGGWCHHKGMCAEVNYYSCGGALDIAMITATMLSAFLIMKTEGIEVPQSLIDRATQNLTSITRGGEFTYGTKHGNATGGFCRAAAVVIGLHVAKMTSAWIYGPWMQAWPRLVDRIEVAHAYGPIHFFALSVAAQLVGQYDAVANHWLPILASRQKPDGSVVMYSDGKDDGEAKFTQGHRVGSTAVYALMHLLKKKKLIDPPARQGAKPGPASSSGKKSPFSFKDDPK
jgi:hypothetical protein